MLREGCDGSHIRLLFLVHNDMHGNVVLVI